MPLYKVQAYNAKGETQQIRRESESEDELMRLLSLEGYIVLEIQQEKSKTSKGRTQQLKLEDQHLFCTMMSAFLRSGLSLTEVLRLLQRQTRDKNLKPVLAELRDSVEGGRSLAVAMQQLAVFRPSLIGMVESGEKSSSLPDTVDRAATLLQSEIALRRKIQSALTYPLMMLGVGVLVCAFLLVYVVPNLTQIVVDSGNELPLATRILLFISGTLKRWGLLLILAAAGFVYAVKSGRVKVKISLFLDIRNKLLFSLIFNQLATLLKAGVPLVQAIEMTLPIDRDKKRLAQVAEDVRQGYRFSQGLEREGSFTEDIVAIVRVGEMGGNLPDCLQRVADNSWDFAQASMQKWANLAEPLIVLVIGALVGFVVLAVLLPIFDLSSIMR